VAELKTLKISVSGVRGVVGETLTPELLVRFAEAYGSYIRGGKVVLGRDTRPSGEMVRQAVYAGLISTGCEVIDLGVCPVPTVHTMVPILKARGGVMITASHNPLQWNALKFVDSDGVLLGQTNELLEVYYQGDFRRVPPTRYKQPRQYDGAYDKHIKLVLDNVDTAAIRKRRFTVALDSVNGAGSLITPRLLKELGCKVVSINTKPDGIFPRVAEPLPENLGDLCSLVKKSGADIGFAQDPDADRLAVVNERGQPIGEEYTVVISSDYVLRSNPGPIVVNLSTTRAMDDLAAKYGVPIYRTAIGEVNVAREMILRQGVCGGEGGGGCVYPAINCSRDSLAGIGLILSALAAHSGTLSSLVESLPRYYIAKDKMEVFSSQIYPMIRKIRKHFKSEQLEETDGLKIIRDREWIHVRASNTEPIIRLIAEATTEKRAIELCKSVRKIVS
jgi:phosphomannomutase